MSTYFEMRCKECRGIEDLNISHGGAKYLQEAYKAREAIEAISEAIGIACRHITLFGIWMEADQEMTNVLHFISEHGKHTLELWDEYGNQYDWETLKRLPNPPEPRSVEERFHRLFE